MVVGGRTQFLAKAQTMPDSISKRITDAMLNFVLVGDKHPRVGRDPLALPLERGGVNLIDLDAQNEAIDITWLQDYLTLDDTRVSWTYFADVILARAVAAASRNVEPAARVNVFLQTWKVSTRAAAGIPKDLLRMVKAARKYGVRLDVRNPTEELKGLMPIWYHAGGGEGRSTANTEGCKCLRERHNVRSVLDAVRVAGRIRTHMSTHRARPTCACAACSSDRERLSCTNPHRCGEAAAKLVSKLQPLWRPEQTRPTDGLSLTKHRKDSNLRARTSKDRVTFDPSISENSPLTNAFRIFGSKADMAALVPTRRAPHHFGLAGTDTEVHTDGSCEKNGTLSASAGSGVWFGPEDTRNTAARLPSNLAQSNQAAEVYAVLLAARAVPSHHPLHLVTDSKYAMDGLTEHLPTWENEGWHDVSNATLFQAAAASLRSRTAITTFRWVKGHTGTLGNEGADTLAKAGAAMPPVSQVKLLNSTQKQYLPVGARLSKLTQRLAYAHIMCVKDTPSRPTTERNVLRILATIDEDVHCAASEGQLWKSIRSKDISRKARVFLWKSIQDAYRIRRYWDHINGYEQRATCSVCGCQETMEHILLECDTPGRETIWRMAMSLLRRAGITPPPLWYGLILGAAMVKLDAPHVPEPSAGLNRLFRIIMIESAYLIWTLRCEHVIQLENDPTRWRSTTAVGRAWLVCLIKRMNVDWTLTRARDCPQKVTLEAVSATWETCGANTFAALQHELGTGVLVGM